MSKSDFFFEGSLWLLWGEWIERGETDSKGTSGEAPAPIRMVGLGGRKAVVRFGINVGGTVGGMD